MNRKMVELTPPEGERRYIFMGSGGLPFTLCTLRDVRKIGVSRVDGSHYLETGDGGKHIITTVNGVPTHIEIYAEEWTL